MSLPDIQDILLPKRELEDQVIWRCVDDVMAGSEADIPSDAAKSTLPGKAPYGHENGHDLTLSCSL